MRMFELLTSFMAALFLEGFFCVTAKLPHNLGAIYSLEEAV